MNKIQLKQKYCICSVDSFANDESMNEWKITFTENEKGKTVEKRKFINAVSKEKAIEAFKKTMESNYRMANRKPVMKIVSCVKS